MGKIVISVLFGVLLVVLSCEAENSRFIWNCEDALPETYQLCKKWADNNYCDSHVFSKQVRMFCRKSCKQCKEDATGQLVIRGKYVGCYQLDSALTSVPLSDLKQKISVGDCVRYCHDSRKAKFAALMLGKYCYCGNSYGAIHHDPGKFCSYQCSVSNQQCGGTWPFVSVYEIAANQGHNLDEVNILDVDDLEKFILQTSP